MDQNVINQMIGDLENRIDVSLMLRKAKVESICEIGVYRGKHLKVLANSLPKFLVGIDAWDNTVPMYSNKPRKVMRRAKRRVKRFVRKRNEMKKLQSVEEEIKIIEKLHI